MDSVLAKPPVARTLESPQTDADNAVDQGRVLLVDDSEIILELISEDTRSWGYSVTTASSGEEALARVAEGEFDVVVSDISMPGMSGLELLATLRERSATTPVVLLSGASELDTVLEAFRGGASDFVLKSEDSEPLRWALERALQVGRLKAERDGLLHQLKVANQTLERKVRERTAELQRTNQKLEEASIRDGLTGLYDHAHFQDRLELEIKKAARHGHSVCLMFIDLDNFKAVNDTLGHLVGDRVLLAVSEMLKDLTRAGDQTSRLQDYEDVAARYGGDEFVICMPMTPKNGACVAAEKIRKQLASTDFGTGDLRVSASIGVACYPDDAGLRRDLIEAADAAVYAAKRLGRNHVVGFHPDLLEQGKEASATLRSGAVRAAIQERAFRTVYQPIVHIEDLLPWAYEALSRPTSAAFANVGQLIDTARGCGLVTELGRVLRLQAVNSAHALSPDVALFINIHPYELHDPQLGVSDALAPLAARIVLEITDLHQVDDYARVRRIVDELRKRGFRIAVDDLGAGYAGLSSLGVLKPDFVKLDMRLVRGIEQGTTSRRLIRHLLEFCEGEGMQVIAEGVETEAELALVRELGCHMAQGFYIARPEPAARQLPTGTPLPSQRG